MYTRLFKPPRSSFFLLGPRGSGKSTLLRAKFPDSHLIDLLPNKNSIKYETDPSLLTKEVLPLPKNQWILIDEIQKVPSLLDEVHFLMESHGYKKFILTGSSARKLKRGTTNLLAGRALMRKFYPLNSKEVEFENSPMHSIEYGLLPMSVLARTPEEKEEYLSSYVQTYLQEEIKYEGLVRNIGSFSRFLEVASIMAGSRINMSAISRDVGVSRDTVRSYFSIFEDTLLGSWLPAYRKKAKTKEVALPKFYWFDSGVLNAASGAFKQPSPAHWKGILFEHWIHHEIKSYMDLTSTKGSLGYWGTPSGSEIDFLWWYGSKIVGIEVKHSKTFKKEFLKGLLSFSENQKLHRSFIVYQGERELLVDGVQVLPVMTFLERLHSGNILGL